MEIEEDFVFPIYLSEDLLRVIKKICKKFSTEVFGYLVGEVFQWKEKKYIVVEDQVFVKAGTDSRQYTTQQIEGAAGKYQQQFQKLRKKKKNDNLLIVGWWHSHPNFGCFLSTTDVSTQDFFFPEAYQVALVVDPIREEFNFFTLDRSSDRGYKAINFAIIT